MMSHAVGRRSDRSFDPRPLVCHAYGDLQVTEKTVSVITF